MTLNRLTEHDPSNCPLCNMIARAALADQPISDHRRVIEYSGPFTPPVKFDEAGEPCCGRLPAGPFTPPVEFDVIDGVYVPKPKSCDAHRGIDSDVDGYGWPPADYLPWGEAEKIIDALLADPESGVVTIGDPFDFDMPMSTGSGVRGAVYLAGPMRGIESFNFPAFHAAAAILREQGWNVFNPAEMDEADGFDFTGATGDENLSDLGFDLRIALGKDLAFITGQADAVAVLPGWQKSKGAQAEVATARALGLPVFDALEGPSRPIEEAHERIIDGVSRWSESYKAREADGVPGPDTLALLSGENAAPRDDDLWTGLHTVSPETHPARPGHPGADGEVRTVSSTGGAKGVKPEQYDQIPTVALAELARHFGAGARKYAAHNFRAGYEWSKCYNALIRHAMAFWGGEDYDVHKDGCAPDCTDHLPESKHIIAVAWHALALATFMDEHPEFDDRYKPEGN